MSIVLKHATRASRVSFNKHPFIYLSQINFSENGNKVSEAGTPNNFREKLSKKLFTPGPLGVSLTTKEAMLRDLGSRDTEFMAIIKNIRQKLLDISGISATKFTTILLQGSGTYSVEAVLRTTTPLQNGKILILVCGAYGQRMGTICEKIGINRKILSFREGERISSSKVEEVLQKDTSFTSAAIVHCETSTGVVNPIAHIGQLLKKYIPESVYIVDAMSSFGAIPINFEEAKIDYLVSSANKCLEGVPGFSFVIANLQHLMKCNDNCKSLCFDLVDQHEYMEKTGQFRFTPPTHALLAFNQALTELDQEGGVPGRAKRYLFNCQILCEGMKKMGFKELFPRNEENYIITSYYYPHDPNFSFEEFYRKLNELDQVIYPGKVTNVDTFRIGNIGHLYAEDITHLLKCMKKVCEDMGVLLPIKA